MLQNEQQGTQLFNIYPISLFNLSTPEVSSFFEYSPQYLHFCVIIDLNSSKDNLNEIPTWKNPDQSLQEKGFGDYILNGPVAAIDAALEASDTESLDLFSFCMGGALSAAALSWLAQKRQAKKVGNRVPEIVLHLMALIGGSPGALLGQLLFRNAKANGTVVEITGRNKGVDVPFQGGGDYKASVRHF